MCRISLAFVKGVFILIWRVYSGFHIDNALSRMHTIRNLTAGLVVKSILK